MSEKPVIEATHGAFMLTLPNMNHAHPLTPKRQHKAQHRIVMEYLKSHPFVTNENVQELLSVKQTRAYTIIREMVKGGILIKNISGKKDNEYILAE